MWTMLNDSPSSFRTDPSLLNRLKNDQTESWQEFYTIYGKLVRDFAIGAGLTDTEADEVVQETAIAIARHLPEYHYDPSVCRFKTWLLNQATWRIKDQIRKRKRDPGWQRALDPAKPGLVPRDDTTRTAAEHRVADAATVDLDALFEAEWRKNLFAAALERVRQRFSLRQFQVFELVVLKEWPALEVAKSLAVSLANVYVIRHRISAAVKREVKRLAKQLERSAQIRTQPQAAANVSRQK